MKRGGVPIPAWVAIVAVVVVVGHLARGALSEASGELVDVVLPVHYAVETSGSSALEWKERRGGVKFVVNKSEKRISAKFVEPSTKLSPAEVEEMRRNPEGFYHLRVAAVDSNGNVDPARSVATSVRNCALLNEGKEVLSLVTDQTGAIVAVQYDRPVSGSSCAALAGGGGGAPTAKIGSDGSLDLVGKIVIQLPKALPPLPGSLHSMPVTSANGAAGQGEEGEKAAPQQTVFQKYWYLFIGLTLISFFLQPPAHPAGEAAGAQAGGASGAPRPKKD